MLQNVPWAGWGVGVQNHSQLRTTALNEKSDIQRLSSFPKVIRLAGSRERIWTKVCLHQNQVFASLSCSLSKEGRTTKNWWFQMLEKMPENPLDSKEIKPVSLTEDQPWIFTVRNDVEAEAPIFWSSDANSWLIGKVIWCWERLKAEG